MIKLKSYFNKKKILITGHTGFKGAWLTVYLLSLGGKIMGISKDVPTSPSLFHSLDLKKKITHRKADIRNLEKLKNLFLTFNPDFVFHLAAQALVKESYLNPIETFKSNIFGTLSVLESLRVLKNKCSAVLITSDKSYKNLEIKRGYKENDLLGGIDPYSSSKASAELLIQTYINSFLDSKKNISLAVARAGNVIGGGDWSSDRLIPDCVKSWSKNKKVSLRNPNSTRPWQHVLEALSGYLILAIHLSKSKKLDGEAFNFGPSNLNNYSVLDVVKKMKNYWKNVSWKTEKKNNFHYESNLLKLNSNKAKKKLNWKSILTIRETINLVTTWYKIFYDKKFNIYNLSVKQIKFYEKTFMKRII